ncbi:hypothetical protein [uncultured phage cr150_1]|uniref:Uncharacterized protein n=1 Tax=uncultured phage cr150_1 TaxID=2986413 RepID=A0AAE7V5K3_9CAUD|nr:hypothetical protein [uncultured phage cr150_1]
MTLNQLVDNILLIARNNNIAESEHLSRIQIEKWIIGYRAMLIKQDIDKGRDINELYLTTIEPIHLDREETVPGYFTYVGDKELPKLIDFNYRPGVINVRDMFGNIIQIGSRTKAKLQKYRKATCKDYIAWVKNNRIYVDGDSNQLEYISVDVIAEDPTELNACFDPDNEFPIPSAMIPTITQMILERELRFMITMPSDDTNDAHDDTQNRVSNK